MLAAAAAVTASVAAGAVVPTAPASAQPCPDVEVVFARGTSEPAGVGRVGQALADTLRNQLGGRTVGTYGVNYPASYDFLNTASGAVDATGRIAYMAAQCPNTRIVLGGYSQGAAVVAMLAGVPPLGDRIGSIGSAPPLPGALSGNVAAVAVFGNPSAKFGAPVSARGAFAGKAIDLCADGDPICSGGRNPFAHTSYERSPFIGQAAGFAAGRV
ncbi:cutinase family protein [Mycolicibacterium austroafricanum]|uniref:Cutinase n=1 Tax=Mycolicibacterium austroafricanum TaxID=39687 RepID=A0ABT8H895_MYCAO|nr:cutinase family protein [Mycolicibacterium austroafricanum]MDN4516986.1 cutinase family protein [Mycolicibacterium austroafricanum]QRZ08082.1 cutinase family protein [Mycolicibacterium austroafricanum]QZT69745.1 cutinase family protein [Mycolicibacterium austroafricanum]